MRIRKNIQIISLSISLFAAAFNSGAQVKKVQMHIAGYLCGN
jgi:hypothetical protein